MHKKQVLFPPFGKTLRAEGLFLVSAPTFRDEAVTDPGLSLYVLLAGLGFEFFAQLADEDAQIFGLVGRLRSPNRSE